MKKVVLLVLITSGAFSFAEPRKEYYDMIRESHKLAEDLALCTFDEIAEMYPNPTKGGADEYAFAISIVILLANAHY